MAEPGHTQSARGAREQSQIMPLPLVQKMHLYCRVIEMNSIRLVRVFLAQLSSCVGFTHGAQLGDECVAGDETTKRTCNIKNDFSEVI